jgi:hypothetical protein
VDRDDVRDLYRQRVKENGGFRKVATTLGISRQMAYALANKRNGSKPGRGLANKILELLQIVPSEWDRIA